VIHAQFGSPTLSLGHFHLTLCNVDRSGYGFKFQPRYCHKCAYVWDLVHWKVTEATFGFTRTTVQWGCDRCGYTDEFVYFEHLADKAGSSGAAAWAEETVTSWHRGEPRFFTSTAESDRPDPGSDGLQGSPVPRWGPDPGLSGSAAVSLPEDDAAT
jgi:hypothetical protein